MIGVGAPWILGLAAVGALATVILHFLSVRRPPVLLLPTMRFLPDRPVRAVSRSARPSDLLLLLMRVAALLLIGVALAGVHWKGTGAKHGRVVVLQRGVREDVAAAQRVAADAMRGGFSGDTVARLVVIDSVAHVLSIAESRAFNAETLSVLAPARLGHANIAPTLSAGLLAGIRGAGALVRESRTVDQVELVIAAPLTHASIDAATPASRALWDGSIRIADTRPSPLQNQAAGDSAPVLRSVVFSGEKPNEAVTSAFAARGWANRGSTVAPSAATAAPAVSVEWPANGTPSGWTQATPDTVGALIARGSALVFPFVRTAQVPEAVQKQGRAIAWWSDGQVAALEVPTANGCTRHVGVPVPPSSDVLHGQGARALLLALSGPCGGELGNEPPLDAAVLSSLQGTGKFAPASAFRSSTAERTPWAVLLLALALALLVAEWWLRDREEAAVRSVNEELNAMRKVA